MPLATLTWKDWKPEPTIAFPRRARAAQPAPKPISQRPPPPATPAVVAPIPQAAVPAPAPVIAPVAVPLVAVAAPEFPVPGSIPPVSQTRPAASKPPVPPPPVAKRRVRGDELISVLFESMHDLHFLRDSIEGGEFCLQLALEKLPSRFGLVYLYDIDRREFVIIAASAWGAAGHGGQTLRGDGSAPLGGDAQAARPRPRGRRPRVGRAHRVIRGAPVTCSSRR